MTRHKRTRGDYEQPSKLCSLSGGGGDGGAAAAKADEAKKQALRDSIDRMYGITPSSSITTTLPGVVRDSFIGTMVGPGTTVTDPNAVDPAAQEALKQIKAEDQSLGDATGSYYTDQLNRTYTKASQALRFRLARQGLLGGSVQSDLGTELSTDKNLGANRVTDAVNSAIAGLDTQREQQRLNAINLVNSGSGESAVSAANAGLQTSLANANSAQKVNLFGDLFGAAADNTANTNAALTNAALASRYYNRLGSFYPAPTGSTKIYSTG